MADFFGPDLSLDLRNQINNAILSYADLKGARTQLIIRSYRRYAKDASEEQIRTWMQSGLAWPGSLALIVWGIHQEYSTDAMRQYALASLFGIERWKAHDLLMLVRERCIGPGCPRWDAE